MNRPPFALNEYYHVYNRGVDKRIIFQNEYDYERFKLLLYLANSQDPLRPGQLMRDGAEFYDLWSKQRGEPLVAIGAWCLMPNHFHLLLQEVTEGGISKFMQKASTAYTMFFNHMNGRSGALLQGTFKSEHVKHDAYLRYLFCYIHMNPLKLKDADWKKHVVTKNLTTPLLTFLEKFPHSSLPEYARTDGDSRHPHYQTILTTSAFPNYFKRSGHLNEIRDWLMYTPF
jgi:putative transposase